MVDFEWYRSFVAIYKHNSVSEAAKTRIMTQPAMSQHLASLEAEAGERLFTRTSRKLVPTERGKQLYSLLAPLIESLEEKTMRLNLLTSPTLKTIRIGTTQELFTEKMLTRLPGLEWNTITYFADAQQLLAYLTEDRADVILTTEKLAVPGIEYLPLMEENFVIVAPLDTVVPDLTQLKDIEKWLLEQQWISYGLELPFINRFWKQFFNSRPPIIPVHVIPSLQLILKAIEEGAGLSLLPTYMLNHNRMSALRRKPVFEHMSVRNELLIGFKSKHKHVLAIHEFIKRMHDPNEGKEAL